MDERIIYTRSIEDGLAYVVGYVSCYEGQKSKSINSYT